MNGNALIDQTALSVQSNGQSRRQPRSAPTQACGPAPDQILQVGLGFGASKTLLSAVELGLFTELAREPMNAQTAASRLGLHRRSVLDFLDALVAMGFLRRDHGVYFNTPETDLYLDRDKLTYVGGLLEMANKRLYGFWGSLTDALRTGLPQNETKSGGEPFSVLYSDPERLEGFLKAMTGISLPAAAAIAEKFPWHDYDSFADIGAAQGAVPVVLAKTHPHLSGIGFDLPVVQPIFERYASGQGVGDRVRFEAGDFFKDPLPRVDVIIMGHILHDWNLDEKRMLVRKAYEALPAGGAYIVYESLIDDERRENAMGLIMSLNMLIETAGGFDYTGADCQAWMREAGFGRTRVEHLTGSDSMVIGIK
jgi:hypothetical protein